MIDSEVEETDGSADHPTEIEETDDTAADHPSELEESDETATDHASQIMSESGSVGVLSAEVRILEVGNGQVTRSMYRQLDDATLERFEPLGRVKDDKRKPTGKGALQLVGRDTTTGALVRYNAQPPDWSASDGPEEFTHWMRHEPGVHQLGYGRGYAVATSKSFAIVWTGRFDRVCNARKIARRGAACGCARRGVDGGQVTRSRRATAWMAASPRRAMIGAEERSPCRLLHQ